MQEGKSVLVRPLPPQAWPLAITVPLSDFLAGSKPAGRAERLTVDSLVGDNVLAPIAAVEPKIAGEETIKGVRCLRLELQQEEVEDGERFLVRLWLAKDKHLIPARQQVLSDTDNGPLLVSESRVDAWLEVKPNVWLPKHITFVTYDAGPGKTRRESRRETFALEKANLDVKYPLKFFRDLQFPPELPVFTIKEGRLEGKFPQVRRAARRGGPAQRDCRATPPGRGPLQPALGKRRRTPNHEPAVRRYWKNPQNQNALALVQRAGVYRCAARDLAIRWHVSPHALDRRRSTAGTTALTAAIPPNI